MKTKLTQDKYRKKLERLRRVLSLENPFRRLCADLDGLNEGERSFCFARMSGSDGGTDTPAARTWLKQREEYIENERKGGRYFWMKD